LLIKINNGVADQKNAFADQKNNSADHFTNSLFFLLLKKPKTQGGRAGFGGRKK
jgi:hypothetical protein